MKKELSVTLKDIEKMTPNKVDELVSKKTKEILVNIQNCTNKIQKAKKAAKYAESMETGGLIGRGERTAAKATATAEALMNTNEAVSELSNIVKESIAFTCLSMAFAQKMTDSIAQMMAWHFNNMFAEEAWTYRKGWVRASFFEIRTEQRLHGRCAEHHKITVSLRMCLADTHPFS
jgi:hypothetical protein